MLVFRNLSPVRKGAVKDEEETLYRGAIAFALRQPESGVPVKEVIRKMGISEQTFYCWKKTYEGMGIAEVRRPKQLVADLLLDKTMLQEVLKKVLKPARKRELAAGTQS